MLGWMILLALLAILGLVLSITNASVVFSLVLLTFGLLFVLGLFTWVMRGRAW